VEAVLRRDLILELLDAGVLELRDAAARGADQVVVMIVVVVGELVAGEAVAEPALGGDAALGEELQRAVHRGVADASIARAHRRQQIFDRNVRRSLEERVDDEASLRGAAQLLLRHVALEALAQAAPGILADAALVVNVGSSHVHVIMGGSPQGASSRTGLHPALSAEVANLREELCGCVPDPVRPSRRTGSALPSARGRWRAGEA
jgi:hypothetical protein